MVPKKRTYNNAEILTGQCEDCDKILPIEKFDIASKKDNKIYYRPKCHDCFLIFRKKYRENNIHQNIDYKLNNKNKISKYNKQYYSDNKEHIQDLNSKNYQKYKEIGKTLEYSRSFRENNKDKANSYARKFYKNKRKEDVGFRINSDISRSIRRQLKINNGTKNNESCITYLPFTTEALKQHLESQFEPWMTWDNRGKYNSKIWNDNDQSTWTWNIDHIMPQSKLPYTSMKDENFKKCWELENLRPLNSKQNIKEGNRR